MIIFSLLVVPNIPVFRSAGDMPGMQAAMTKMMMNDHADDAVPCECCCKPHDHLDSLPHPLAPHALDLSAAAWTMPAMLQTPADEPPMADVAPRIPTPPPRPLVS